METEDRLSWEKLKRALIARYGGRRLENPFEELSTLRQTGRVEEFVEAFELLSSRLVSLQFDEQYFLASSMDGSIRLYDHRLLQRGAVQCYDGHVNSHTRIQIGVDPAERFVMSGGEDCKLRLWSLKSGELLFEDKFSNSIISAMCYKTYSRCMAWITRRTVLYALVMTVNGSAATEPEAAAELPYAHVTKAHVYCSRCTQCVIKTSRF
ncbi:hypothetical protein ACSQ67_020250 [Phaseolus vulgaris]